MEFSPARKEEQILAMHNEMTDIFERCVTFFRPHSPQENLALLELTSVIQKLMYIPEQNKKIYALRRHITR